MTLNQMLYFKMLTECGNMGQAAEKLYISQPSLSVAIAKLETELGVSLFKRKGHRMILTSEGAAFLDHVKKILQEVEECTIHMHRLADSRETMIRLGCITPLLWEYFPEKMQSFLQQSGNSSVQFEFSIANTAELVRRLKNGLYDFLLCSESADEEVIQVPILSQPLVLITPENLRQAAPASWEALAARPLIGYEENSVMDRHLQKIAAAHGVQLKFLYRAPTEDAIASLVEHGFGSALLSWSDIPMKTFRLSRFPVPGGPYTRQMYLTTVKGEKNTGAAARFISFLQKTSAL